jgi:hypothetical protein
MVEYDLFPASKINKRYQILKIHHLSFNLLSPFFSSLYRFSLPSTGGHVQNRLVSP